MTREELLKLSTIDTIVDVILRTEDFEQSYERSQERILEDIETRLEGCQELDSRLLNDIKDYGFISEEKAFMLGIYEGIRLMRNAVLR